MNTIFKPMRSTLQLVALSALALIFSACATARLTPADEAQRVPNKPKAAAAETKAGVLIQAEADAWNADDRVRDEVTTMKVTIINRGKEPVDVDYNAFLLRSSDGSEFKPVSGKDITIRGAARSIGLPADTIITRSSDSAINAPGREQSEKEQLHARLEEESLRSGVILPGDRAIGYIYFERVPNTKKSILFLGRVLETESGNFAATVEIPFRVKEEYE